MIEEPTPNVLRFYLAFTTRPAADKALSCLPGYMLTDDDGNPVAPGKHCNGKGWHGYHVGPVVKTEAVLDADGKVITAAVMDNRHHVNILTTDPDAAAFLKAGVAKLRFVFPTKPRVTWQSGSDADASFWA